MGTTLPAVVLLATKSPIAYWIASAGLVKLAEGLKICRVMFLSGGVSKNGGTKPTRSAYFRHDLADPGSHLTRGLEISDLGDS
jgi:hypothetical protein